MATNRMVTGWNRGRVGLSAQRRARMLGAALLLALGLSGCAGAPSSYMGIDLTASPSIVQALAKRAKAGDKWSQFELALFFEEGRWVEQDSGRALELFREASKNAPSTQTSFIPGASGLETVTVAIGKGQDGLKLAEYRYHLLRSRSGKLKPDQSFAELDKLARQGNEFAAIDLIRERGKYLSADITVDGTFKQYENTLFQGDIKHLDWPNDKSSFEKIQNINPVAVLEFCRAVRYETQSSICDNKSKLQQLDRIVRLDQAFPNCVEKLEVLALKEKFSSYDCTVSHNDVYLNFEFPEIRKNLIWHFMYFVSDFDETGRVSSQSFSVIREFFAKNSHVLFSYNKDSLYLSGTPRESLLTAALTGMFITFPSHEICDGNHCRFWRGACNEFRLRFHKGRKIQRKFVSSAERAICAAQHILSENEKFHYQSSLRNYGDRITELR